MLLEMRGINVFYGAIHALHDMDLVVKPGEIVTLIGANGAGKSTTLKTISGLVRSKTGQITFKEDSISRCPAHTIVRRGISHVPEGRRVFANLTVQENLELGAYTNGQKTHHHLQEVYARFPRLAERHNQLAGTLSGGEQQMLAIGRALMSQPVLLLLDEPSMGLAPLLVKEIFSIIAEIQAAGTTILLVEQNAHMALSIAHRGYVLEAGRVVLSGYAADLAADPRVQQAYLGGG